MKYYLINTDKIGTSFSYPDVGHKDYSNCGYSPDETQCIWRAEDSVDMKVEQSAQIQEITKTEAKNILAQWGVD